jgi:hypothetical protein
MKKWYGKHFLVTDKVTSGLSRFFDRIDPKAREKGLIAFGLQLINNSVNGSPNESVRAPIRDGRLRGSGTVFVGSKKVGDTTFLGKGGTPALSYTESNLNVVTVGFNTEYAANMHENLAPEGKQFTPGGKYKPKRTAANVADVGGKFLERHLKADRKELVQLYTDIYRKEAGT